MPEKIKLGISACLLGEKVRYDGQHKRDHYLCDIFGPFVKWVPVCPEVECGMPVPREAMRLVGDPENPRLLTINTKTDKTEQIQKWARKRIKELENEDLCGYIFKSKSPSSGLLRVRVYNEHGIPCKAGVGLFAKAFTQHFPLLPVEEEGRLNDSRIRQNFIEKVYVYHRWSEFVKDELTVKGLTHFHTTHKLLLMSHSPENLRGLGRIVANSGRRTLKKDVHDYVELMMKTLSLHATVKKNTNVLHHLLGYFKKPLSDDEKQEMVRIIDDYRRNLIPLIVPVTLLQHFVRKYNEPFLKEQYYLHPHPDERMLRNHV